MLLTVCTLSYSRSPDFFILRNWNSTALDQQLPISLAHPPQLWARHSGPVTGGHGARGEGGFAASSKPSNSWGYSAVTPTSQPRWLVFRRGYGRGGQGWDWGVRAVKGIGREELSSSRTGQQGLNLWCLHFYLKCKQSKTKQMQPIL